MFREQHRPTAQREIRPASVHPYVVYGIAVAALAAAAAFLQPEWMLAVVSLGVAVAVLGVAQRIHRVQEAMLTRLSETELTLSSLRAEVARLQHDLADAARARDEAIADARRRIGADLDALREQWRATRAELERAEAARNDAERALAARRPAEPALPSALRARVAEVGASDVPCLVVGPSDAARRLVARAIHAASPRAALPFLAVSCAEPDALARLAAGGPRAHPADGGTVFLDAVDVLPLAEQQRILDLLPAPSRAGRSTSPTARGAVRVIAGTAVDLEACVRALEFREDLFLRLDATRVHTPRDV